MRSLRFRLTAWFVLALAFVLGGASIGFYEIANNDFLTDADQFLTYQADQFSATVLPQLFSGTDKSKGVEYTAPEGHSTYTQIYLRVLDRQSGDVLADSPSMERAERLGDSLDIVARRYAAKPSGWTEIGFAGPTDESMVRELTRTVDYGSKKYTLQFAVPWDRNSDLLERLALILAVAVCAVTIATGAGGYILISRTLQPIDRIVTEAERIDAASLPETLLPSPPETDSELGRLTHTLNAMMTRLRTAFEARQRFADAQQRFAADASHELRTPLTILRGSIELSLSRSRDPESYKATLVSSLEEIDRLSRIVEGLSLLARHDAGVIARALPMDDVDLGGLTALAVSEFGRLASEKKVVLAVQDPSDDPIWVRGSEAQLRQLVDNLIDNALKYTPAGGRVTVVCGVSNRRAEVAVTDTGIGIAEEDLPHVFERFWRADKARSREGSGLGLAISSLIAQAHGGTLTVKSKSGAGSTFTLSVPVVSQTPASAPDRSVEPVRP